MMRVNSDKQLNTMKTKQIGTWLPCFSGFYNTIWQSDHEEEMEIEHLNEEREKNGFEPAKGDDFIFDYADYNQQVIKGIASYLESNELKPFVTDIKIEGLRSPKEYNFSNDSADIMVTLSKANEKAILKYLTDNKDKFAQYLKDHYTSCSGFWSSYPNTIDEYMIDKPLEHSHKLGSILDFIANNENTRGDDLELGIYYNVEKYLSVTNYDEIVNGKLESDLEEKEND
jgi:hypothetical protein